MAEPLTYLEQNKPKRSQFRRPRRANPSGAIVVHTAENAPDLDGPDGGAEGVARFIANRPDPGSYHTVVDADSIIRLVPYDAEAYGEGTGGNPHALHLAFACRTTTWDTMDPARRSAMLENGARAAADMARWLKANGHPVPYAGRVVAGAYRSRSASGFISHAALDPGRRSDPGASFPWGPFLDLYAARAQQPTGATTVPDKPPTDLTAIWQQMLLDNGANLGPAKADGQFGRLTLDASQTILDHRNQLLKTVDDLTKANATSSATIVRLQAERDDALALAAVRLLALEDATEEVERLKRIDTVARDLAVRQTIASLRAELDTHQSALDAADRLGGGV